MISPAYLAVEIPKLPLQQKDRKRLLSLLKKIHSLSSHEISDFICVLNTRGLSPEKIFGIEFQGSRAHYSDDISRFRHCIGLADAVYLSSKNLGVRVSYPARVSLTVPRRERIFSPISRTVISKGRINCRKTVIRGSTRNSRFRLILHYLRIFPKGKQEKELVKLIKTSLVDAFCVQADQQRPEGLTIPLFPEMTQRKLDLRFQNDRRGRIRFYKNLLESKSLCAPVGDDMIREAYEKHRASLCRPSHEVLQVPEDFLQKLFQRGQEVGRFVQRIYDPYHTKLPNTRATVEKPRHKGGAREALRGDREITLGPPYLRMLEDATRPEPFVIGLFGPPGVGKTTTVQSLVSVLTATFFPEWKKGTSVYSRSCSSKYWDGYRNQPIVVLDDFGQDLSNREDLVEFEQLVSVNRYQLEMASLEEKGRIFTSPIIIVTSNMSFGTRILGGDGSPIVEESVAVWRRFHLPLLLGREGDRKGNPSFREYNTGLLMYSFEEHWMSKYQSGKAAHFKGYNQPLLPSNVGENPTWLGRPRNLSSVLGSIATKFREHTDFHENELSESWRQVISCQRVDVRHAELHPFYEVNTTEIRHARDRRDVTVSLLFPRFPPYHSPVVDAIAIPEPLKVRMITKAEAETKCLQPLQRALFEFLKSEPQFALTHGVTWNNPDESWEQKLDWIYRIEEEIKKIEGHSVNADLWLSGDYTAATDNFPMSVTNALVEGMLSEIRHEPTKAWVRYEVSPHRIRYPGLDPGEQTSGQLMGSLLSFPLLCLLNDFIVSESGFEKGKYLINGDDVVAKGPPSVIETWKRNAPKVGLDLSLGKNFIDPSFCTVNSQLFWEGKVMHTGKVSCQTRHGKSLSRCFSEAQFYYGSSDELRREFIRRNLLELRKTPRSLDVPCSHGGLALDFSRKPGVDLKLAKKVYLYDYLSPFHKSLPVPGFDHIRALLVPTGFFSDEELRMGGGEDHSNTVFQRLRALDTELVESENRELTHSELQKRHSRLVEEKNAPLWRSIAECPLSSFPPVGTMKGRVVYIQKGKVGFLKERIITLCLHLLRQKLLKGDTDDPDVLGNQLILETFEDEWYRLFENDDLPPDGKFDDISQVLPDDPEEHLLPGIRDEWVLTRTPPTLCPSLKTLIDGLTLHLLDSVPGERN